MVRGPCRRIASSSARLPTVLFCQYSSGETIDSGTSDLAAKCSTASMPPLASTSPASVTPARTNSAPAGTASACPVDRSSSTVTWWPAPSSSAATTLPM
jgi:hypothetical protein